MSRKAKQKNLPQSLEERLIRIDELRQKRKEIDGELNELLGLKQPDVKVEAPFGFDYFDSILDVFKDNNGKILGIDEIAQLLEMKYKFHPDRDAIVKQTMRLASKNKIERIEGRRGKYLLKNGSELVYNQQNT